MKRELIRISCLIAMIGTAYAGQTIERTVQSAIQTAKATGTGIAERRVAYCRRMPDVPDRPQSVMVRYELNTLRAIVTTNYNGPTDRNPPPTNKVFTVEPANAITAVTLYVDVETKGKKFRLSFKNTLPGKPGSLAYERIGTGLGQTEFWQVACE